MQKKWGNIALMIYRQLKYRLRYYMELHFSVCVPAEKTTSNKPIYSRNLFIFYLFLGVETKASYSFTVNLQLEQGTACVANIA